MVSPIAVRTCVKAQSGKLNKRRRKPLVKRLQVRGSAESAESAENSSASKMNMSWDVDKY